MLERLLEGWLDKINERGYQPAFCTALSAQGYTIVHNTRHSPIELGKDVIARAPDGKLFAFQLKGDPGGRMGARAFRELIPQLDALVTMAWSDEPPANQFPILVTNGYVEEEARLACDQYNKQHVAAGRNPLEIWDRGQMFKMVRDQVQGLFPTEPELIRRFLNLHSSSGTATLPVDEVQRFFLDLYPTGVPNEHALARASFAAAIMSEVMAGNFAEDLNHFELIKIRICCSAAILSWHHHAGQKFAAETDSLLGLLRENIFGSIDDLEIEYITNGRRLSTHYLADGVLIDWRREVLGSLFAASLIEQTFRDRAVLPGVLAEQEVESRSVFCADLLENGQFWGETSHLMHFFAYLGNCAGVANGKADIRLVGVLMSFAILKERRVGQFFPSAYYGFEEVVRSYWYEELHDPQSELRGDNFYRRSKFMDGYFHLAVRKNWKHHAKEIWPTYVRMCHLDSQRTALWRYALPTDDELYEKSTYLEDTGNWYDCLTAAEEHDWDDGLDFFRFDLAMCLIWLVFFPHRATSKIMLGMDRLVMNSWNLEDTQKGHDLIAARTKSYAPPSV